jgi:hypothetical protein
MRGERREFGIDKDGKEMDGLREMKA